MENANSFQKQPTVYRGKARVVSGRGKTARWVKDVGLGFKAPRSAFNEKFIDKKCPFTGMLTLNCEEDDSSLRRHIYFIHFVTIPIHSFSVIKRTRKEINIFSVLLFFSLFDWQETYPSVVVFSEVWLFRQR